MAQTFIRKRNRMNGFDYSTNGLYFITFNTKDCQNTLCDGQTFEKTALGELAQEAIERIPDIYSGVDVLTFTVMPNHIHLLLCLQDTSVTVSRVVQQLKGVIRKKAGIPIWHISFHDRIVRNEMEMQRIWEYIDNNPAKWQEDRYYQP